jgi:hypothetical protein
MTNQPLKILNSDPTAHNVHTYPNNNEVINLSQITQGASTVKTFTKEEIVMPVQCDVHNWMRAFIGVFTHPYHSVSKAGGAYEFKVPAGDFEVTAIHEKYGKKTMMVTVADGATAELNFTFSPTDK